MNALQLLMLFLFSIESTITEVELKKEHELHAIENIYWTLFQTRSFLSCNFNLWID